MVVEEVGAVEAAKAEAVEGEGAEKEAEEAAGEVAGLRGDNPPQRDVGVWSTH